MIDYDELRRAQDNVRVYRSALLKLNRENAALRKHITEVNDANAALRTTLRNLLPGQVQLDAMKAAEVILGDAS